MSINVKIREGGVYISRCGTILRCDRIEPGTAYARVAMLKILRVNGCHEQVCIRPVTPHWKYSADLTQSGQFVSREWNDAFHLHLATEIKE